MDRISAEPSEQLAVATSAIACAAKLLGAPDAALSSIPDDELIEATRTAESIARQAAVLTARFAAELARRSRPELGGRGLAIREGFVNPESLVRSVTRTSFRDAARRIRVGAMLIETEVEPGGAFDPIAASIVRGDLGIEAADGVLRALKPVVSEVDLEQLKLATATLALEGGTQNADDLGAMARDVRDTLDRMGVASREERLRAQRSLRKGRVIDGLRRVSLVLDPESDAIIIGALDHAMSPRLGGPRFVDPADRERAARLVDDDRTNEQLALDTLVDLVRIGVDRDDGRILGSTKPGVRVTISLVDLLAGVDELGREHPERDTGVAWLEGCTTPLTPATARRILCDVGALPIVLGGAHEPLELGRTRRLFSGAQRTALADRDGGCRWPGCDRPTSWSEAHHLTPFGKGGTTDLENGILLCRRHHLLLHNDGWWIERAAEVGFRLIPPTAVDPARAPRPMPTKRPGWVRGEPPTDPIGDRDRSDSGRPAERKLA